MHIDPGVGTAIERLRRRRRSHFRPHLLFLVNFPVVRCEVRNLFLGSVCKTTIPLSTQDSMDQGRSKDPNAIHTPVVYVEFRIWGSGTRVYAAVSVVIAGPLLRHRHLLTHQRSARDGD